MPHAPARSPARLTPGLSALVFAWLVAAPAVSQDDPGHWAWQPLDVRLADADLEQLLEAARRSAGLTRAPAADRVTLVRRAHLVLHGLPPAPEALAEAVDPPTADWLTTACDRLLASRRHAERQTRAWLDLARFAETHGFETNTPRPNAWRYRDWLVDAFHRDLPYDQFVTAQLAGDRIGEDPATGFLVAGPWDEVKSPDAVLTAEQRSNELADMVGVTGTTFLAATIGCARCHDHKFDPIRQRDFYAMEAVFAGVQHGDRAMRPTDEEARQARIARLEQQRAGISAELARHEPLASRRRVLFLDDEDPAHATPLRPIAGHGENPAGDAPGQREDPGDDQRAPNLSRGRYTWWNEPPAGTDLMAWRPRVTGRWRLWVSWGAGFGTHTTDATWLLDRDGDLSTDDDRQPLVIADQQRPAHSTVDAGRLPGEPRWSGLRDAGEIELLADSQIVLRSGTTGSAVTADLLVLAPPAPGALPRARSAVSARGNVDRFEPRTATALRFTVEETLGGGEPCIDELRVFEVATSPATPPRNVALADHGAVATASGEYPDNPIHKIRHANDGRTGNGRSWIPDQRGQAWLQIDFAAAATIDRVEWARDAEGRYADRLATRYRIEVCDLDGTWQEVASSDDRIPHAAPAAPPDRRRPALLGVTLPAAARQLRHELGVVETQLTAARTLPRAYAGRFVTPPTTHRLHRGDPTQPREAVAPGALTGLAPLELAPDTPGPERRLALARWLTQDARAVLARVIVNRIWQQHFGTGLVTTPNDFGRAGATPSHPEVLDALAAGLIAEGWSLRSVHRRILATPTWRQSDLVSDAGRAVDSSNRLLHHFPSRRLAAESIRDSMLHATGELVLEDTGGPGFDVFEPNSNYVRVYLPRTTFGPSQLRRAVYATRIRMERDPTFGVFDCPDGATSVPRRARSTTALQAFSLLNSPFVLERAEALAARLHDEFPDDPAARVARAFELVHQCPAERAEVDAALQLVAAHGLPALCRALFNTSEFLFLP